MKKFTTVAVIAAMAFATQALAKGGSMGGGQSHGTAGGTQQMTSIMSTTTMKTGATMTTGNHTMTSTATMDGAGTMSTTMPNNGMSSKPQLTPVTPMQPAATK
jgi:hypothetical protein